ncbi:putative DNA-binding protein (MmcQ/YjbR family) [Chitinophaga skermanii]|uniref:Putative DNA-binding protein (MmcQ/YjbR family) n=1 Tax=Chitinophaga skermanii TaxID=331697 RepID=A0A327QQZ7_9BACT|nr:MmcQ/YjbR family DNA-binding protein [Chitinophaga skermanii]RAJ07016.1 putative DNA-binding protein (MmcQ/YjbR family) [Chitinophaga skermanii]
MNIEMFREFCLSLPGTTEGFPFGEENLVFFVKGKMFAITDVSEFASVNLKCDPEEAVELRERYEAVLPGYHMNKKHWNTVLMDGTIPKSMFFKWVRDSYDLVVAKLPKKDREELSKEG